MRPRKTVVLMTALVPTLGHAQLIEFASNLSLEATHVIVGSLAKEPVKGSVRTRAIAEHFLNSDVAAIYFHDLSDELPQEPAEHPDFWSIWRDVVLRFVPDFGANDAIVASETYGRDMATALGGRFIPYDMMRETISIKGDVVRKNIIENFEWIIPEFQRHLVKTITVFGPESCGKTTMSRRLAADLNGWFVPEYARGYLETVGAEITEEKMQDIVIGQTAAQKSAISHLKNRPFIFQDTDLFSTLGYYRLWGHGDADQIRNLRNNATRLASDLYIVMNDNIPFEADPLRYGGDKRESGVKLWTDLLGEFGQKYVVAPVGSHEKQAKFLRTYVTEWFEAETKHIWEYER